MLHSATKFKYDLHSLLIEILVYYIRPMVLFTTFNLIHEHIKLVYPYI
jgi:hypothetical protein